MKKINTLRLFLIICSVINFVILCHHGEIAGSMIGTPEFHDPPFGEYADALHNMDIAWILFSITAIVTALAFFIPYLIEAYYEIREEK